MALITECTKVGSFSWTKATDKAFQLIKKSLTEASVLCLSNFELPFELTCDTSYVGIGGVLSQNGHPIAFFGEKLNETRRMYSTYDLELYGLFKLSNIRDIT